MRILGLFFLLYYPAHAEISELKVTEGKFTEAQPMQQQDRMEGSKAAAKAAAAGSAMGKVNCMMMMNEALKEPDKKTKMMMMMMANQQCQQAAELEKSAAENDKGRKALTMNDIPKQAKFQAGKAELQGTGVEETKISFDEQAPARDGSTDKGEISLAKTFMPDLSRPDASSPAEDPGSKSVTGGISVPGEPLSPIDSGKIQFDDSQKNAGIPLTAAAGMMGLPSSLQSGSSAGAVAPTNATIASEGSGKEGRSRGIASDSGAAGSSSDAAEGGKGEATFDALMSQLMGGEPAAEEGDNSEIQIWTSNANENGDRANIFEYATIRYRRLSVDDKRLGGPAPKTPERALASAQP